MGKVASVDCVGFLVEGTGACVLMDEAESCLFGGPVVCFGVSVTSV